MPISSVPKSTCAIAMPGPGLMNERMVCGSPKMARFVLGLFRPVFVPNGLSQNLLRLSEPISSFKFFSASIILLSS